MMISKEIQSREVAASEAPKSQCIKVGDMVFISGQFAVDEANRFTAESIEEETFQVIRNIVALLSEINLELRHVVKTTIFIKDLATMEAVDLIYATYFSQPYPVRNVVEVARLNHPQANIMIDCVAIDTLAYEERFGYKPYDSTDYGEHDCDSCPDGDCYGGSCCFEPAEKPLDK